ncbi:peptidase M16 inactive domain protein [Asticcacaulis biprosthecium C19]|uniref:Peptidase M16 inactive domain protein n=1 Tax=Asticcacaulis biprosthecium C19 TaxID=715226 RepID=F4QP51_9CAUL|nr:peptidase M16 inactive domain protein [Asticcacaulis biprosthecium C19]
MNRLKAEGVTAGELAEFIAVSDAQMENLVRTHKTRFGFDIAEDILSGLIYDNVFETATQLRADWARVKPALTVAGVKAKAGIIFNSDNILLSREGEDKAVLDETALVAAFAEAEATPDAGPAVEAASLAWPYTQFGPGSRVEQKTRDDTLSYTHYVLENGVRVNIRPNSLVKNQILVKVRFEGGYLLFSPQEQISLAQLAFYDLQSGGLGKMSQSQLGKTLSTRSVTFDYDLEDDAAVMTGDTTRDSFATQMQLLMAYTVDPGFRPEMFENVRGLLGSMYQQVRGTPGMAMGFASSAWLSGNDPRYVLPDEAQMQQRTPRDIEAIIRRTITGVPVEITIAGDIREEAALEQVRRTFGNLPKVPDKVTVAPGADKVRLPADRTPQVFHHEGRPDQSISLVVFPTTDALANPADTRGMRILAEIFNARLEEDLRQRQGLTYDTYVGLTASETMKGYGYIAAQGTIPPDKDAIFYDTVLKIAADIVGKGVTAAELERARNPMIQYLNDDTKNNEDWYRTLGGLFGNPVLWDYRVSEFRKYTSITQGDINTLARRWLKPEAVLRARAVREEP